MWQAGAGHCDLAGRSRTPENADVSSNWAWKVYAEVSTAAVRCCVREWLVCLPRASSGAACVEHASGCRYSLVDCAGGSLC
jgi:hypothetical protein